MAIVCCCVRFHGCFSLVLVVRMFVYEILPVFFISPSFSLSLSFFVHQPITSYRCETCLCWCTWKLILDSTTMSDRDQTGGMVIKCNFSWINKARKHCYLSFSFFLKHENELKNNNELAIQTIPENNGTRSRQCWQQECYYIVKVLMDVFQIIKVIMSKTFFFHTPSKDIKEGFIKCRISKSMSI